MTLCKYFFLILRNFIRNFHYLGKFDLLTSIHQKEPSDYKNLRQSILQCKKQIICNYYSIHPTEAITYKEELNYLNSVDFIDPFPYPTIKHYKNVQSGFDEEKLMSFVLHNEKKMYLPKGWGTKDAVNYYLRFIERENILYLTKFPKVGDKVARQIILDLKGKLVRNDDLFTNDGLDELMAVLESLGYKKGDIKKILPQVDASLSIEQQIKDALKLLMR